jgi:hypothetical protein
VTLTVASLKCANIPFNCVFSDLQWPWGVRSYAFYGDHERPNHGIFTRGYDRPRCGPHKRDRSADTPSVQLCYFWVTSCVANTPSDREINEL